MDDKKREEFLARLRETFRGEASEHLEAITAGLLAIERAGSAERLPIVEHIFREAHSLKGAARSVSLSNVEAMCMELESIFAAMKRGNLSLSTEMLDTIHSALGILAFLCRNPGATPSPEDAENERHALVSLKRILGGGITGPMAAKPADADSSALSVTGEQAAQLPDASSSQESPNSTPSFAPDTVRISTQKLGAILLEAEELMSAKIAANTRAARIRSLASSLSDWNRRRFQQAARQRRGREGSTSVSEFFESEMLFSRTLENSLRKLAGAAHQDALSLAAISDRLLESTRNVLLLPCSYLLSTLPPVARDMARDQGKELDLVIGGEDIEIDRRVLDEMKDPLIHLLRNCIDHGIERTDIRKELGKQVKGSVSITVEPVEGNRVMIKVADDGAGVNAEKVIKAAVRQGIVMASDAESMIEADVAGLIFQSGLSTSPIITDLSGRGLGLAIVREKVEKLGGTVSMTTTQGAGTVFFMVVPLTLATFRGVFVEAASRRFVIPTANVVRVSRIKPEEIRTVENRQTITIGDQVASLVRLRDVLELSGPDGRANGSARQVVLVRADKRQIAFLVDEVEGEQEVNVKSLGRHLMRVRNVAGASISGSGEVIPILNVNDLMESAISAGAPRMAETAGEAEPEERARLLIAEDSITSRTLVKSILEGAGYEVVATVDGMDALTRLKTEPFDLVVSDVDMPRMNGFELTAKIRADKKLGDLPVVLVTALGSQKDREYGIEVGANAYIVKTDFDQGNLLEIIRRLL